MIDWKEMPEKLHDIRRALLRDNIDLDALLPFAISREEQLTLKGYFGLTHELYNDIDDGAFLFHGFHFVVSEDPSASVSLLRSRVLELEAFIEAEGRCLLVPSSDQQDISGESK